MNMQGIRRAVRNHPVRWGLVCALAFWPVAFIGVSSSLAASDLINLGWALATALPVVFLFVLPEATVALGAPVLITQFLVSDSSWYGNAVLLVGLVAIAARRELKVALAWTLAVLVVVTHLRIQLWLSGSYQDTSLVGALNRLIPALLVTSPAIIGAMLLGRVIRLESQRVRMWEQRAEALERDRALSMAYAAAEERSRIAAELHDVLGHTLAVIAVQVDAARTLLQQEPAPLETVRDALKTAHDAALQGLGETRAMVHADVDDHQRAPQPTLADLPALITSSDPVGGRFELVTEMDLASVPVSQSTEIAIYRIVQEALTNVLKHAGPQARARITMKKTDSGVEVEIADDGVGGSAGGSGRGLTIMAQRAHSVGGDLHAAPGRHGGFVVTTTLPTVERI